MDRMEKGCRKRRTCLALVHVAEELFHRGISDGPAEEEILNPLLWNDSQQRQKQKKSSEPTTTRVTMQRM